MPTNDGIPTDEQVDGLLAKADPNVPEVLADLWDGVRTWRYHVPERVYRGRNGRDAPCEATREQVIEELRKRGKTTAYIAPRDGRPAGGEITIPVELESIDDAVMEQARQQQQRKQRQQQAESQPPSWVFEQFRAAWDEYAARVYPFDRPPLEDMIDLCAARCEEEKEAQKHGHPVVVQRENAAVCARCERPSEYKLVRIRPMCEEHAATKLAEQTYGPTAMPEPNTLLDWTRFEHEQLAEEVARRAYNPVDKPEDPEE